MKTSLTIGAVALSLGTLIAGASSAQMATYGVRANQLEYRFGENNEEALAWDFDYIYGTDELKFLFRSTGEMDTATNDFGSLETQLRLQKPISTFFDAVVGLQANTPTNEPDRTNLVLAVQGLAPQWFEIEGGLYLSEYSSARFEAEYTALLTNRLFLIPDIEVTMPFVDDIASGQAAGGATVEIGARLSYDLVGRAISPYIGVNYEKSFGGTADLIEAGGGQSDNLSFVVGTRLFF